MPMKEQVKIFFTALMFYTRIPCPKWVDHSPDYINKATRYLPLMGYIVGAVAAAVFVGSSILFGTFVSINPVGLILSMAATAMLTGAFHEDGFADVCDGFGGGWSKEQILTIMKDSRLGTFGTIGLVLLLATKVALLAPILAPRAYPEVYFWGYLFIVLLLMVSGHSLSRLIAATMMYTHSYVRDDEASKAKPVAKNVRLINLLIALPFGLLPVVLLVVATRNPWLLLTLPACYLAKAWLARFFKRWIGGYTGDCLGATQQVTEVVFYATVLAVLNFSEVRF